VHCSAQIVLDSLKQQLFAIASVNKLDAAQVSPYNKYLAMILLLRDAMHKHGLCCRPVSVRLSVCHVDALYLDG